MGVMGGACRQGDHPSDSGTEMLLREAGNRSAYVCVSVCVCVCGHVKVCLLCECMFVS